MAPWPRPSTAARRISKPAIRSSTGSPAANSFSPAARGRCRAAGSASPISWRPASTDPPGWTARLRSDKADLDRKNRRATGEGSRSPHRRRAEVDAALTGALAHLDATLKATLGEGRLLDRPTSGLDAGSARQRHHRPDRRRGFGAWRGRPPAAERLGSFRQARRRRLGRRQSCAQPRIGSPDGKPDDRRRSAGRMAK